MMKAAPTTIPAVWTLLVWIAFTAEARTEDAPWTLPAGNPTPESIRCGFPLADFRIVDLDGRIGEEFIGVGEGGEIRVWPLSGILGKTAKEGTGLMVLPDPAHSLLNIADVLGTGMGKQLAVLSPEGLVVYEMDPVDGFKKEGLTVSSRARFRIRVGVPRFSGILPDVNGDGRPDLLVPNVKGCELWVNCGPGALGDDGDTGRRLPRFRKAATVATEIGRHWTTQGEKLSDELENAFWIPYLRLEDVNGDGRPDLIVVRDEYRGFHLQRADGAIPKEPDVSLNLEIFTDTTPEASLRPGKTLAGGDDRHILIQDLDGDGIPDYVIGHRRKLWIFHGSKEGPRFTEPTAILKVAADITAIIVLPLDNDVFPDLLLLRVQVPTVATLLKGLFTELDVEITATGYASKDGRTFSNTPKWKGEITIRLPAILGIIRDPEALIRSFEETAAKFRTAVSGDFNGDGAEDTAMVSVDGKTLEVWMGVSSFKDEPDPSGLRYLFFDSENPIWTIDRILSWLGGLAQRRAARITQGRNADLYIPLRDPGQFRRMAVSAADLEGAGRHRVVVVYRDMKAHGEGLIDLYRIP